MLNRWSLASSCALLLALTASAASAAPWVLLIQPAPFSANPPPYNAWQPFQQFEDSDECLDAKLSLHYQYWPTDQDLSKRALEGICRDEETGKVLTGGEDQPE